MIDIAIEECFKIEFSQWDNIDRETLNLLRRSYREKFVEEIEYQLNMCQLESDIEQMQMHITRRQMEQINQTITRTFTVAIKKIKG